MFQESEGFLKPDIGSFFLIRVRIRQLSTVYSVLFFLRLRFFRIRLIEICSSTLLSLPGVFAFIIPVPGFRSVNKDVLRHLQEFSSLRHSDPHERNYVYCTLGGELWV